MAQSGQPRSPRSPRRQEPTAKARLTGLLYIIIVAIIWIAASFVVQELHLHPFLLTYICNILFVVYIPVSAIQGAKRPAAHATVQSTESERQPALHSRDADTDMSNSMLEVQPLCVESSPESPPSSSLVSHNTLLKMFQGPFFSEHTWKIIRAARVVAPFWFLAQLCFNVSLHLTSVTSNTILSSPSSLFTYFLSIIVLREKFTYGKLTGVGLTVLGGEEDTTTTTSLSHAVIGDMLTLAAAALYAVYTVLLKLAGSFNVFTIGRATLSVALLKGLFDNTLADYLWSKAVILIGPTMATVALQLQVPMAMLVDPLLKSDGWWTSMPATVLQLSGATSIMAGFFWLNFYS